MIAACVRGAGTTTAARSRRVSGSRMSLAARSRRVSGVGMTPAARSRVVLVPAGPRASVPGATQACASLPGSWRGRPVHLRKPSLVWVLGYRHSPAPSGDWSLQPQALATTAGLHLYNSVSVYKHLSPCAMCCSRFVCMECQRPWVAAEGQYSSDRALSKRALRES